VTSQGTAHGRFQRAIEGRQLLAAEVAARELGGLRLPDALSFCLLLAELDPRRYEPAAVRWHGRFALEVSEVSLAESQLVLAALAAIPEPTSFAAVEALRSVARRHGLSSLEAVLRHKQGSEP